MRLESLDFTGFLEGYRRNEESTTEGIDTDDTLYMLCRVFHVEMKKARLRALTLSRMSGSLIHPFRRNEESTTEGIDTHYLSNYLICMTVVEMKKARLRALTHCHYILHNFF